MPSAMTCLLLCGLLLCGVGCGNDEPEPATPGGGPGDTSQVPPTSGTEPSTSDQAPPNTNDPEPAPRIVSPADDGRVLSLATGGVVNLVAPPDPSAPPLGIEGDSVEVVEVVNITDSGSRQWELRAIGPGTTRISGAGDVPFEVTFVVDTAD